MHACMCRSAHSENDNDNDILESLALDLTQLLRSRAADRIAGADVRRRGLVMADYSICV